ncbi:MAG: twin-arginine translocase TatA/TatE family subunit [Opitutae bacterium]|nr:twin-arginine translocase TatA/TatE family subunit [Opitutae bacterium]
MEGIGGPELMMILFIILLLFGANKLPELARGLGKSIKEFKRAASGVEEQFKDALEEKHETPESKRFAPVPPKPPTTFPPYPPGSGPAQPSGTVSQQPPDEKTPPDAPAQ